MNKYDLTYEEDLRLRTSIFLPGKKRTLYEYFCQLPPEVLQAYPNKGCHWWLGKAARTPEALALRDYILHWRLYALRFRRQYSREYLESLSLAQLQDFLHTYIEKTPSWAYTAPLTDVIHILSQESEHLL